MNIAVNGVSPELKWVILPVYIWNIRNDGETLREVIDATATQSGIEVGIVEQLVCGVLGIDTSEIDDPRMFFPSEIDR